ncbi:hypothetical protein AB2762_08610 [Acinetobacter indicus]
MTKSLGLKQCEGDDPKVRLQQLKEQLQQAGIEVYDEALGHDGLVHITVCGAEQLARPPSLPFRPHNWVRRKAWVIS